MRAFARPGLPALALAAALTSAAALNPAAHAQEARKTAPPAAKGAGGSIGGAGGSIGGTGPAATAPPPGVGPAPAAGPTAEDLKQPLATVNNEVVTRGELLTFLSRYQIPPGNDEVIYRDAIDTLVNMKLVNGFLTRLKIPVSKEKIDEAIASFEKQLKQDGDDLATEMLRNRMSMADLRNVYADRLRWIDYLNSKGTDAELQRYATAHKDLFNNTQVKASHVMLKVEPKATAAEREAARQKLLGIKKDILGKKLSFADAATKYSEVPAETEGVGGDVGYFGLNSGYIEEFANSAFALKPGEISDPVQTPYGEHLITVTDRREGTPLNFEQNKPFVKQMYASELQKNILSAERKKAKIDVKPMPTDLFPPAPTAPPSDAPAAGPTAKPAARPPR